MDELDVQQEIKKTKRKIRWGCLVAILLTLILPIGLIMYPLEFKKTLLVDSESPNGYNDIQVYEKGEPFLFGFSEARVRYGWRHKDISVGNDGAPLNKSNVNVVWEDDQHAVVHVIGAESEPQSIEIRFR